MQKSTSYPSSVSEMYDVLHLQRSICSRSHFKFGQHAFRKFSQGLTRLHTTPNKIHLWALAFYKYLFLPRICASVKFSKDNPFLQKQYKISRSKICSHRYFVQLEILRNSTTHSNLVSRFIIAALVSWEAGSFLRTS